MATVGVLFGCVTDVSPCNDSQVITLDWWFIGGIVGVLAVLAITVAAIVLRYRRR